ncbi:MAG TPA: hypothetical protein VFA40_09390 [Terriglobales bacterium]|nr:hypothetical protein [Terriglobales bacterium]
MRWSVMLLCLASTCALAQEGTLQADFRRESERVSDACGRFSVKAVPGCGIALFTDHPLHIAAGSMPPQNGFSLGAAFVTAKNTENWRLSWDVDAVGSFSGSWRAGGYMKLVHTPREPVRVVNPVVLQPGETQKIPVAKPQIKLVHPYTVFNLYAQTISLNKLNFFGLGNDSALAGASVFGMREAIVGGSVIKPVYEWSAIKKLNLALLGEVNGRFVDIRGENGQSYPSIESVYTNASAPGLNSQPAFMQFGEGVRVKPVFGDRFQLNYLANYQQFFAPSNSRNSFQRWTLDLTHIFYLYGYTKSAPRNADLSGPDRCAPPGQGCPEVSHTRNLNGSIGMRLLLSESMNSSTSAVPFYFQQTLGGSDINGAMSLGSYRDYRYRAPNVLLLQESFEHSLWGPFGVKFIADQGRVALTRSDVGFDHLKHSFASGFTLRAGGFPMVWLMFAWGGSEGHHNVFNMNTSLLGGSARPLLD